MELPRLTDAAAEIRSARASVYRWGFAATPANEIRLAARRPARGQLQRDA
jgi:hypothetical protein